MSAGVASYSLMNAAESKRHCREKEELLHEIDVDLLFHREDATYRRAAASVAPFVLSRRIRFKC